MCRVLSSTIDSLIYTPDPNGNRSTLTRAAIPAPTPAMANTTYNAANQLLAYNGKTLSYDANGNLQNRIDSCGTTIYDWDGRNRLTGISGFKPDCTTLTAGFSYDGLNRRTSKTINGTTTQFIYDGIDIIQEVTSGIKTNYVRTLNVDEPLTRITNGDIRHYLRDGLGSIIGLTDDTGSAVATFSYDAFGNTASAESFGYTGRENDGTGLLYYRARYYSPEIGRFISEDPIRLRGGINYFGYVQNNPINFIDPTGLDGVSVLSGITTFAGTIKSIASPQTTAGQLVTGIAADSAAQMFNIAPNQTLSDVGGITTGTVSTGLALASGGAGAVALSGFGLGLSIGNTINHLPMPGTNGLTVQQAITEGLINGRNPFRRNCP